MAAMTGLRRERVAREWKAKFGEVIDCPELVAVASREAVDAGRLDLAIQLRARQVLELLNRQQRERSRFLADNVPGTDRSLADLISSWRQSRASALGPASALAALRVTAELSGVTGDEMQTRKRLAAAARKAPKWIPAGAKNLGDYALGFAASHVALWIEKRSPDRRPDWNLVFDCLQWHGNDLPKTGSADAYRGEALKKRVQRAKTAERNCRGRLLALPTP